MKTTNATTVGTFFSVLMDGTGEMDWQWNGNETLADAVYYSRGGYKHNASNPSAFSVTSPHTTFHGMCH